jgi:SpoVK/Ycf46/Vps4 family AAA+-type ATPase
MADIVLPMREKQLLRNIVVHVKQKGKVYREWGFDDSASGVRGLGLSALFSGESGTGKTMAAEALANELELELLRIDLSMVVSKYIGETEKNLRQVFDAAEGGGVILFFDEADALFGKRSEVSNSHDRYANIEVGYLLQRMETYRGLAILATNMKSSLDPAFIRRINFIVNFPFPDENSRAEIWKRIFPQSVKKENLDVTRLARLNISGGNIRNIALHASFLAAEANLPINMNLIKQAAQTEYDKLGRPLTKTEVGDWS